MVSESGPEGPKVDPRGARTPFQEPKCDFLKFAFSPARERDSEGSKRPRERPNSSLGAFSGPRTRPHNPRQHQTGPGQAHDSPVQALKNPHTRVKGGRPGRAGSLSAAPSEHCGVMHFLTLGLSAAPSTHRGVYCLPVKNCYTQKNR